MKGVGQKGCLLLLVKMVNACYYKYKYSILFMNYK
jgi:hypothetical protein